MSGPTSIINKMIIKDPPLHVDPEHILTYDVDTKELGYVHKDEIDFDIEIDDVNGLPEALDSKLDKADYNDRFKGKFTSLEALNIAFPTAGTGDYAIVDPGVGVEALQYIWDVEEGWLLSGETAPETTDELFEGNTNLYFTGARVLSTILSGLSLAIGGPVISTDTVLGAFGKIQKQINDVKSAVDAIFVPNTLISSVPPTRSGNTFTYPASGYVALINKTLRTNPAQFVTTIAAAATANHKRVDLIYFKPDNTLDKLIGDEDLVSAPRPDVPNGCVGISFTNVFGNVIEDPTPITNQISIQDHNGVEKYVTPNYLRFKNVTFDETGKVIIIDPLQTLAAYLDPINGNDAAALVQNANRPFQTMAALVAALPETTGETYTIYITGGTIPITRLMPSRNLKFIAYGPTTLDFSYVKLDDGVTEAVLVFRSNAQCVYTFENANISIVNNYVGMKGFCTPNQSRGPALMGYIVNFNWKSTNVYFFVASILGSGTDIYIENLYDSSQDTLIFSVSEGFATVKIGNYFTAYKKWICASGQDKINIDIANITEIGSAGTDLNLQAYQLKVGNVNMNGILRAKSYVSLNITGSISDGCYIDFVGNPLVTGNIISTQYHTNGYLSNHQIFRDFTGKLSNFLIADGGQVEFQNCTINVVNNLLTKYWGGGGQSYRDDIVISKGSNTIIQDATNGDHLFKSHNSSPTPTIEIADYGTLKTNVNTFGKYVNYMTKANTFKEELNKVVIRSKYDLLNRVLSPTNKYVIDISITDFADGEYIIVPEAGLTFGGNGIENSVLGKNVAGQGLFKSPVGGSGNLIISDVKLSSGAGSVFDLFDSDGTHAIEINDVNFEGCASLGKIKHYRQLTGLTIGVYGCSDGLTVSGVWDGFSLSKLHVRTFGATGTLFKKDTDTSFGNRFFLDGTNLSGATGVKLLDFDNTIFIQNESLQITNSIFKINGVINESNTAALIPNITANDPKSRWTNSTGIKLTAFTFLDLKSPDGNIWRVTINNSGILVSTAI